MTLILKWFVGKIWNSRPSTEPALSNLQRRIWQFFTRRHYIRMLIVKVILYCQFLKLEQVHQMRHVYG